jgi:hypothetical protein
MSESKTDRVVLVMLRASLLAMDSLLQLEMATVWPAAVGVPAPVRAAAVETGARSQSMRTKTES